MPARKTASVKRELVDRKYASAYLCAPVWSLIFSESVNEFLMYVALSLKSRPEFVIGLLLLMVANLAGPKTRIAADTGDNLKPNVYLFLVGLPTTGKSSAFRTLVQNPSVKLENDLHLQKMMYQSFTAAGLLSHLAQNDGHGMVCADEVCHELVEFFGTSPTDAISIRKNLNNFWSGQGHDKVFRGGAKKQIVFTESYFSLGGTSQPDVFCMFLSKIVFPNDGLQDRMLVLCGHGRSDHPCSKADSTKFSRLSSDWVEKLYRNVYTNHREEMVYKLDAQAKDFVQNMRKAANEHRDDVLKDLEESVSAEADECEASTSAEVPNDSKDMDYVLKLATLIHMLEYYLKIFQTRGVIETTRSTPPMIIGLKTVKGAYHLISKMRTQFEELKQCIRMPDEDDSGGFSGSKSKSGGTTEESPKSLNIVNLICSFPGPVVSSRLLARKYRNRKPKPSAGPIIQAMMDACNEAGQTGFFGAYSVTGNQHVFHKAPAHLCDFDFLKGQGMSRAQYVECFETEVRETIPVSCVYPSLEEWQKAYDGWMEKVPEIFKQKP